MVMGVVAVIVGADEQQQQHYAFHFSYSDLFNLLWEAPKFCQNELLL